MLALSVLFLLISNANAAINGPCSVGPNPGVCVATGDCAASGGTFVSGFCPNDPADIKCCYKPACGSGGACKWTSQCSGTLFAGYCPGPVDFKCCVDTVSKPPQTPAIAALVAYADAFWDCTTPLCATKVPANTAQPQFQCAEFVSRALAAAGYVPGLTADAPQSAFINYKFNGVAYSMVWTGLNFGAPAGLEDFLKATGWVKAASTAPTNIHAGSVIFTMDGRSRPFGHVVVGVDENTMNAHNNARFRVKQPFFAINAIYNKPVVPGVA